VNCYELFKIDKCRIGRSFTHTNKNTRDKLHRTNATVWFNELCSSNHLTLPVH